jgi:hypothetical protein
MHSHPSDQSGHGIGELAHNVLSIAIGMITIMSGTARRHSKPPPRTAA